MTPGVFFSWDLPEPSWKITEFMSMESKIYYHWYFTIVTFLRQALILSIKITFPILMTSSTNKDGLKMIILVSELLFCNLKKSWIFLHGDLTTKVFSHTKRPVWCPQYLKVALNNLCGIKEMKPYSSFKAVFSVSWKATTTWLKTCICLALMNILCFLVYLLFLIKPERGKACLLYKQRQRSHLNNNCPLPII